MITKTITFTDYNGNTRTQDYMFHLNAAEVFKWLTTSGEYTTDQLIDDMVKKKDGRKIMEMFESLIKLSYGVKSLDGVQFIKNQEELDKFVQSEAYATLFTELVTDADAAAAFVNGIIPKNLQDTAAKLQYQNKELTLDDVKNEMDARGVKTLPLYTEAPKE